MSAGIGEGFPVRATDPVLHRQPACRRQVPKRIKAAVGTSALRRQFSGRPLAISAMTGWGLSLLKICLSDATGEKFIGAIVDRVSEGRD